MRIESDAWRAQASRRKPDELTTAKAPLGRRREAAGSGASAFRRHRTPALRIGRAPCIDTGRDGLRRPPRRHLLARAGEHHPPPARLAVLRFRSPSVSGRGGALAGGRCSSLSSVATRRDPPSIEQEEPRSGRPSASMQASRRKLDELHAGAEVGGWFSELLSRAAPTRPRFAFATERANERRPYDSARARAPAVPALNRRPAAARGDRPG